MKLGAFSVSLSVQDLQISKEFYEKLGFEIFGGDEKQNYLIMKNWDSLIGIFQDMFQWNILTFTPGWNQNAENLNSFTDVRMLHDHFKSQGIEDIQTSIENSSGPWSFSLVDPDGNTILIDQHV